MKIIHFSLLSFLLPCATFLISGYTSKNIGNIEINEVYKVDKFDDEKENPSYIKFINKNEYVAIPYYNTKNDYEEGKTITFIKGNYSKKGDTFKLGKNVSETKINFSNYEDFKNKQYYGYRTFTENEISQLVFESGSIYKKKKEHIYKYSINDNSHPSKKITAYGKLKPTKHKIPSSQQELLSKYTQVSKNES